MKKKKTTTNYIVLALANLMYEVATMTYFNNQPALVKKVELPAGVIDANWVDILPKEEAQVGSKGLHHQSDRTNVVRQDFDRIRNVK